MNSLSPIIEAHSGVYRLDSPVNVAEIEQAATQHGLRFFHIDGSGVTNTRGFLQLMKVALQFPAHFGNNLDALLDMLRDLSWLPANGYVLLFSGFHSFAEHDKSGYGTALDVLHDAAHFWAERMKNARPMIIFIA